MTKIPEPERVEVWRETVQAWIPYTDGLNGAHDPRGEGGVDGRGR